MPCIALVVGRFRQEVPKTWAFAKGLQKVIFDEFGLRTEKGSRYAHAAHITQQGG